MPTRQERRRQERLAKKKGLEYNKWAKGKGKEKIYDMSDSWMDRTGSCLIDVFESDVFESVQAETVLVAVVK